MLSYGVSDDKYNQMITTKTQKRKIMVPDNPTYMETSMVQHNITGIYNLIHVRLHRREKKLHNGTFKYGSGKLYRFRWGMG